MAMNWERSPIANSPISFVVTAYSAGAELHETLASIQKVMKTRKNEYEIIVVPCNQSDLEPIIKEFSHTRIITDSSTKNGVGTALKKGIEAAKHPLIFTIPPGYSADQLPDFLKDIDFADLVVGTRQASQLGWWRLRRFFTLEYQVFGMTLADPYCPVRLYRKEVFRKIPIQSIGAFAHTEILAKANFTTCLLGEVMLIAPLKNEMMMKGDRRRLIRSAYFGPPPEKSLEKKPEPIITVQAPESRS